MQAARFLTPEQVADELNVSRPQAYALMRRGDLEAIKLGGRGVWRVERSKLEDYIQRAFGETRAWVREHPFSETDETTDQEAP